ncbi:MAG: divalent-cation tolerance protein CutA [Pirellulales bacterium]|nr:divalent-cation tolerance protein CutA [Pirellulales bacterium]
MADFIQITTTVADGRDAERIARTLVERRLAACVQIVGPLQSVYRWNGAVEQAEERLCIIKTTCERYSAVEAALGELHPYECPEIIAQPIECGSANYLAWLADQTS